MFALRMERYEEELILTHYGSCLLSLLSTAFIEAGTSWRTRRMDSAHGMGRYHSISGIATGVDEYFM